MVIPTTKEAEEVFITFDNETRKFGKDFPVLDCLWAKGEENARRIALIVACGNSFDCPIIDLQSADYACRLIRYLLLDFGNTIAPDIVSCETNARKRKLIKLIGSYGLDGVQKSVLTRSTHDLTRKLRNDLLDDLIESGEVAFNHTKEKRAVVYRYWTAENYSRYVAQQ